MASNSPLFGFDPSSTTVVANYGKVAEAKGDIADAAAKSKSATPAFDFLGLGQNINKIASQVAQAEVTDAQIKLAEHEKKQKELAALKKEGDDARQATLDEIEKAKQKAAEVAAKRQATVDNFSGRRHATTFMADNEGASGSVLQKAIEDKLQEIATNPDMYSQAYLDGVLSIFDGTYVQATKQGTEERVNASLNVATEAFMVDLTNLYNNGVAMTEQEAYDWAAGYAQDNGINVGQVRDAMLVGYYKDRQMRVITARNPEELEAAIAESKKIGAPLMTPTFRASKAADKVAERNQAEKDYQSTISAKVKEFTNVAKVEHQTQIVGDTGSVYTSYKKDPALHRNLYDQMYPNDPAQALKAYQEDVAKYESNQKARTFIDAFQLGKYTSLPAKDSDWGKAVHKEVATQVRIGLASNLSNPTAFTQIVLNHPQVISDVGKDMYNSFQALENEEEAKAVKAQYQNIRNTTRGGQALQNLFGDKYKSVVGSLVVGDVLYNGSLIQGRSAVATSSSVLNEGSIKPEVKQKMFELSDKLGPQGSDYEYVIGILSNNKGDISKDDLNDVYDFFADSLSERAGVSWNAGKQDFSATSKDPETFEKGVVKLMEQTSFLKDKPGRVIDKGDGIFTFYDKYGTFEGMVDSTPIKAATDALYTANAIGDAAAIGYWSNTKDLLSVTVEHVGIAWDTLGDVEASYANEQNTQRLYDEILAQGHVDKIAMVDIISNAKTMYPSSLSLDFIEKNGLDAYQVEVIERKHLEIQNIIDNLAEDFFDKSLYEMQLEIQQGDANLDIQGP